MVLVDWEIENFCSHENNNEPLVTPFDKELVNPASLDIRIGDSAMYDTANGFDAVNGFHLYDEKHPFYLHPNMFLLVSTLESFNFPATLSGQIDLKSTVARMGLGHSMSGWVDCGFWGVLTLELKNYSEYQEIPIFPGMRVAQIIFHPHKKPNKTYKGGKYAGHKTVKSAM